MFYLIWSRIANWISMKLDDSISENSSKQNNFLCENCDKRFMSISELEMLFDRERRSKRGL